MFLCAWICPCIDDVLQGEELSTSDYLLKIFKVSIPHMPKTAAKFGHELQAALQPMIIKPSGAGGVQVSLIPTLMSFFTNLTS